jgi:hypothetical protein
MLTKEALMTDDWDKLSLKKDDDQPTLDFGMDAEEELAERLPPEIDRLAEEMFEAQAALEQAKERVKRVNASIARFSPEVPGETILNGSRWRVSVKRGTRYEWDDDILHEIYGPEEMPDHVRVRLSVDKRVYDALPLEDRAILAPALTVKLTSPAIEVAPNV